MEQPCFFNSLPAEIYVQIFKKLHIKDLDRLGKTSIRFENLVTEYANLFKVKSLIVDEKNVKNYWFYTLDYERITKDDRISLNSFPYFSHRFNLRTHLKRLAMQLYDERIFNVSSLNEFRGLQHLELFLSIRTSHELVLENLKIFYFGPESVLGNSVIRLNAVKLEILGADNILHLNIIHPNSIKYYHSESNDRRLNEFVNLEHFRVCDLKHLNYSDISTNLERFRKLRVIDLNINYYEELVAAKPIDPTRLKKSIKNILKQRSCLGWSHLKVYLQGVLCSIDNLEELTQHLASQNAFEDHLKLRLKNYKILVPRLDLYSKTNYSILVDHFKNKLPPDFFQKFCDLTYVIISEEIADIYHLKYFLEEINILQQLVFGKPESELTFSNFNWKYLAKFPHLDTLYINSALYLELDFRFLAELTSLKYFQTNQPSDELFQIVTSNFSFMERADFCLANGDEIKITRMRAEKVISLTLRLDSSTVINKRVRYEDLEAISSMQVRDFFLSDKYEQSDDLSD